MQTRLCESCRSKPAEFLVSRVVGGHARQEARLCASCAVNSERARCGDKGLLLTELLQSMLAEDSLADGGSDRTKVCPTCGNTDGELRETGMLGCGMCYVVFREDIDSLIAELHGYTPGQGKPG